MKRFGMLWLIYLVCVEFATKKSDGRLAKVSVSLFTSHNTVFSFGSLLPFSLVSSWYFSAYLDGGTLSSHSLRCSIALRTLFLVIISSLMGRVRR
jgi:hypothetical protein